MDQNNTTIPTAGQKPRVPNGLLAQLQWSIVQQQPANAPQSATSSASWDSQFSSLIEQTINKNTQGNNSQTVIPDSRVNGAKYTIYSFVLAVVAFILWWYLSQWRMMYDAAIFEANNWTNKITSLTTQTSEYDRNKDLIQTILAQSGNVISAFNQDKVDALDIKGLTGKDEFIRSFLLLSPLEGSKMKIDEKKILTNLNVFLLRSNPDDPEWRLTRPFGDLKSINIGKEKKVPNLENLYEIPVSVNINFDNKDALLQFVKNVELRIPGTQLRDFRILYKIDTINYDLVRYFESQEVSIVLKAYYFK